MENSLSHYASFFAFLQCSHKDLFKNEKLGPVFIQLIFFFLINTYLLILYTNCCLNAAYNWRSSLVVSIRRHKLILNAARLLGDSLLAQSKACRQWCKHTKVTVSLHVSHGAEADNHDQPINVVRDNRSDCRRVLPTKNGIENTPATTTVELSVAAVDVPDTLVDVVRTRARANFCCITSDDVVPGVNFEGPDGFAEESGGDEIQETSGDDEEDLERCCVSSSG